MAETTVAVSFSEARASRGLSLDQVARDTLISMNYLEALEAADYSVFPGSVYVIGFIRIYASYLGLDPVSLIDRYRMQQSAVQTVPEEVSPAGARRSSKIRVFTLIFLVIVAGVFILERRVINPAGVDGRNAEGLSDEMVYPFAMGGNAVIRVLEIGSMLYVPLGDSGYQVLMARYEDGLVVDHDGREVLIPIGSQAMLDLNGDNKMDLKVLLNSVDQSGAVVRVNLTLQRETESEQISIADRETQSA